MERIARRAAELVIEQRGSEAAPWLTSKQAAAHIASPVSRIHDLVALGLLHPRRDGRRLLFRRDDLDAYLEASAR